MILHVERIRVLLLQNSGHLYYSIITTQKKKITIKKEHIEHC